jgi:hypothetical protein
MRDRNIGGEFPQARPDAKPPSDTKSVKITTSGTHHRQLKKAADAAGLPLHHFVKSAALKAAREQPK